MFVATVTAVAEDLTEARLTALREYVADAFGCRADRVHTAIRFADGNRHDVYKVSYFDTTGAEEHVVVRVSLTDDGREREQVVREATVLETLDGIGAPQLRDVRLTSPWFPMPVLSMQFVPGHSLELSSATPTQIEHLGRVLASVHDIRIQALADSTQHTGTVLSYAADRLRHILHGLPWARGPLPSPLRDRVRRAADALERNWVTRRNSHAFLTDEVLALLHGDIAFGNVLWDQRPVLIDWEYARLGDRSDEIAYLFDQNSLSPPQREAFWRGYRSHTENTRAIDDVMERVSWWEPLTLLGSTLWWVERWVRRTEAGATGTHDPAAPKDPDYYFLQAATRLDRLESLLN